MISLLSSSDPGRPWSSTHRAPPRSGAGELLLDGVMESVRVEIASEGAALGARESMGVPESRGRLNVGASEGGSVGDLRFLLESEGGAIDEAREEEEAAEGVASLATTFTAPVFGVFSTKRFLTTTFVVWVGWGVDEGPLREKDFEKKPRFEVACLRECMVARSEV